MTAAISPPSSVDTSLESSRSLGKLSFSERKTLMARPTSSHLVEGDDILLRPIDRAPPGDVTRMRKTQPQERELVKQRSNFFEDAFSVKESNPAKERAVMDSIVSAEVKTNVIISDEFTFITELSYHLATRYQRPVSSVVVTLHHGACMLFGGTFDPAYIMTVTALPSQLLPATNKRNAALIQRHMHDTTGVDHSRGLLRFVPIIEENVAVNGKTLAAEIDDLERNFGSIGDDSASLVSRRSKARKKLSVKSLGNFRPGSAVNVPAPELTPPSSADEDSPPPVPKMPAMTTPALNQTADVPAPSTQQAARRKKSFVASIFGRSSSKADMRPLTADSSRKC